MSEISTEGKGGKGGKKKPKKMSTRVDFTPMVDLGFLLITFFMLVTTMIKPNTMEIGMPTKDNIPDKERTKINDSKAVTIILGKNDNLFYYEGTLKNGKDPEVVKTNYSAKGIREYLLKRNGYVVNTVRKLKAERVGKNVADSVFKKMVSEAKAWKDAPVIMIKATDDSNYKNLVDILDEMTICNIGKFAIVDINDYDKKLIKDKDI
jgi:biopolymer transport protein ExbD